MLVRRYWQPFSEVNTVKQQLDQLFDDLSAVKIGVEGAPTTWTPAATLVESEAALTLHIQLPGVDAGEIDIQASREVVAVSGSRSVLEVGDGENIRRNEFRYGGFRRVVSLPEAIDHTAVSASYDAGILVLHLPKAEEARNKVVKVNIAGTTPAISDTTPATADTTPAIADTTEETSDVTENAW